jgi:hypothetical protein
MRVGTGGGQQLSGGVRADPVGRSQPGIGYGYERVDLGSEGLGLGLEELHSLSEHLAAVSTDCAQGSVKASGRQRASTSISLNVASPQYFHEQRLAPTRAWP